MYCPSIVVYKMNHLNLEQFLQTKITNDHYDEIAILMPRNVFI